MLNCVKSRHQCGRGNTAADLDLCSRLVVGGDVPVTTDAARGNPAFSKTGVYAPFSSGAALLLPQHSTTQACLCRVMSRNQSAEFGSHYRLLGVLPSGASLPLTDLLYLSIALQALRSALCRTTKRRYFVHAILVRATQEKSPGLVSRRAMPNHQMMGQTMSRDTQLVSPIAHQTRKRDGAQWLGIRL